jgi:hypothetical protein
LQMGKSHKRLEQAAKLFVDEMATRFPGVEQKVTFEDRGGYEVWIRVVLPEELTPLYWQVDDAAGEILERLFEETGVNILAGASTKKPELVPMRGER